jgi:hypothetical protein
MTVDLLEQLQLDAAAVLAAAPALADATVLADNEGDIEARVLKALGPVAAGPTGKAGLVLIVMLPEVTETEPNVPGPPLITRLEVQVIENVLLNRGTNGTQVRSSHAAVLALNILHHWVAAARILYAAPNPIEPVPVKPGHVSHLVTLSARLTGYTGPGKTLAPSAALDPQDDLVLTCATAGAAIYYTTDQSFPAASNAEAVLYDGPVPDLAPGTVIRAAAYATGLNPSDLVQLTLTT